MGTIEKVHLCIGCWYAECGGVHVDPDFTCSCCVGTIETGSTPDGMDLQEEADRAGTGGGTV